MARTSDYVLGLIQTAQWVAKEHLRPCQVGDAEPAQFQPDRLAQQHDTDVPRRVAEL